MCIRDRSCTGSLKTPYPWRSLTLGGWSFSGNVNVTSKRENADGVPLAVGSRSSQTSWSQPRSRSGRHSPRGRYSTCHSVGVIIAGSKIIQTRSSRLCSSGSAVIVPDVCRCALNAMSSSRTIRSSSVGTIGRMVRCVTSGSGVVTRFSTIRSLSSSAPTATVTSRVSWKSGFSRSLIRWMASR